MRQCSILYINANGAERTHVEALRMLGFQVVETRDLPDQEALDEYHAVLLRAPASTRLTVIATRMRAKPRFGRRVLVALVPAGVPTRDQREAVDAGFDLVITEPCGARDVAAAILGRLRRYPEHHCVIRTVTGRRKAA